MTKAGYRRTSAAQLLQLAGEIGDFKDSSVGGFSLYELVLRTLEVETARASNERLAASVRRETVMKELFISHYRAAALGGLHDIDQRNDEVAFAFLATLARYPASVFDLRPIRQALHNLAAPLTPRDASLMYWADAYDAIVCYREITPLGGMPLK